MKNGERPVAINESSREIKPFVITGVHLVVSNSPPDAQGLKYLGYYSLYITNCLKIGFLWLT